MAIEVYKRLNYLNEITEKLVELEGSDDALRLTSFYGLTTKEICYKNLVKSFRWDKIKLKRCPKCHAYIDFNLPRSIDRSEKRTDSRQASNQATGSESRASKSNQKTSGSEKPAIESEPRTSKNKEESLKKSEPQVDSNQATRRGESQADKNNNEVTSMESESLVDDDKESKVDPRADKNNEESMKEGDPRTDNESVKKGEPGASSEESKKRIDSSDSSGNRKQANFEVGKVHFKVKRKRLLIRCNQCKFTKSFAITSQYKTVYERLYSSYLSGLK